MIAQGPGGQLQYTSAKCKLEVLWETYRDRRRDYEAAKLAYEEERAQTKFLKTPKNEKEQ